MVKTEIIHPYTWFKYYGDRTKHMQIKPNKTIKELLTELGNNRNYVRVCYVVSNIQAGKLGLK